MAPTESGQVRRWSFVTSPRWIAGHLLVAIVVAGFVQLGFWQLRRLDERRTLNDVASSRLSADPTPLAELLGQYGDSAEDLEYRRVSLRGRYEPGEEVIVQGRSLRGVSGHHVATPLVLPDARAVIVNRGWVPIDASGPPVAEAPPPDGQVTVAGVIRRSQERGLFGPTDPEGDDVDRVARIDLGRLRKQMPWELLGFYVELDEQRSGSEALLPIPLDPPSFGEGSHLSYAVQWFLFAGIALGGYPMLLWRTAYGDRRPRGRVETG